MKNVEREFLKYLTEVDAYFELITTLDKGVCKIVCIDIGGREYEKQIDGELIKILKANCFLLLYNIIEATIRNSITAIIRSIHGENMTFKKLSEKMRVIWINQELSSLNTNSFNVDKLREKITDISIKILDDEFLKFEGESIKIGGNLDAQKIRNIANKFGYNESKNGGELLTIKKKRNNLAHGAVTFSETGKDYSVNDLLKFKKETENYLKDVLAQIDLYINAKIYAAKKDTVK